MNKVIPNLWFDDQAEQAARFYCAVFGGKIRKVTHYNESGSKAAGRPKGSVMTVEFELLGDRFVAINGGPVFKFTPAISLQVNVKTQKELDRLWDKLSADPAAEQCGWLKDKYGVSWQIVPEILDRLPLDGDARSERVFDAMLKMKKLDVKALEAAARGPARAR